MEGAAIMRFAITSITFLTCLMFSCVAGAQSTISNRPFDLVAGSGVWGAFMPGYELGSTAGGDSVLSDPLDDAGYYGDLKAIRRFLGTRTSFEARAFYAYSGSRSAAGVTTWDVTNPLGGESTVLSDGVANLSADTDHYGYDIGLRDTWRTRFGGLSAGCYFSYMAFDQTFDVDFDSTRLLTETLNSDYIGGKGFVGWDGCLCGNTSMLDFVVGFYQLRSDYRLTGGESPGSLATTMRKTPITLETVFSSYRNVHSYQLGWTFATTYIAQMPVIERDLSSEVLLDTDSGFFVRMMFEILL